MKTFVSHKTALAYWRKHFPLDSELGRSASFNRAEACTHLKQDILSDVPEMFREPDKPVDTLVFEAGYRRASELICSHLWSGNIPDGAFYKVGTMYVSSPEFVFAQLATSLTVVQLIALGCELCGTYTLLPQGQKHASSLDDCPKRVAPLTNVDKINAFIEKAGSFKGAVKARRAIRYIAEGARSPMETMTYLLLCLPPMLGGYGLPKPELNATIRLDREAQQIAKRRYCEGDICWRQEELDIEYYGEVHGGMANVKSDAGRTLGIEHMGWHVLTVTSPQVFDMDQFEVVALAAAKHLGRRIHPRNLGHTAARLTIYDELTQWMFND